MTNKLFNFNDFIVTFTSTLLSGGKLNINNLVRNGGFGEGNDVINVIYEGKTTKTVGASGSVQMNNTTNNSGEINFKFLYISGVNSTLIDFFELTKNNNAFFNVSIADRRTGRVYTYLSCTIESLPDITLGLEAEAWTWKVLFSDNVVIAG